MKSATHIEFYPADKLHANLQISNYLSQKTEFNLIEGKSRDLPGKYVIAEFKAPSNYQPSNFETLIAKIEKITHHHLLQIEYYSHELSLDKGKKNYILWLFYEDFTATFDEVVKARRDKGFKFHETDLNPFFKNMISLFASFQHINYRHKNINPKNFLMTNGEDFKFDGLDLGPINCLHPDENEVPMSFLAPEELARSFDAKKSTVFQLGLIFLNIATLDSIDGLNKDPQGVASRIAALEDRYSGFITETLKKMLEFKPADRMSFDQLYKYIKENETTLSLKKARKASDSPKSSEGIKKVGFHTTAKDDRRGSFSGMIPQVEQPATKSSKFKTDNNSESLDTKNKLNITCEKSQPKHKLLLSFEPGTKRLQTIQCISEKNLIVEVVNFDNEFDIPDFHTAILGCDDKIYLIGGDWGKKPVTNAYCYAHQVDTLTPLNPMIEKTRLKPGVVAVGDKIYVMGGGTTSHERASLATCEVLNTKTGEWKAIANMHFRVIEGSFVSFRDSAIYRIGGIDDFSKLIGKIERYDIMGNMWHILEIDTHGVLFLRNSHTVQVNNDEIFVFGGTNLEGEVADQTYILDCGDFPRLDEKIGMLNVHQPLTFVFNHSDPGQLLVAAKQIYFMGLSESYKHICTFDGLTWKECKKLTY